MKARRRPLPHILLLIVALALPSATALAKEQGFKAIVKHIESNYRAKRMRIPFLGLANFAVKIVRPAGVKGFKVAVFEDQDFSRHPSDTGFETVVQGALAKGWQPLLRRRSRHDGDWEHVYIYTKTSGKDTELISVVMEPRQAVVVEAKVNTDSLAKFIEQPSIMGKSLAGTFNSGSPLGSLAGLGGSRTSAARSDRALPAPTDASQLSLEGSARDGISRPVSLGEERPKPKLAMRDQESGAAVSTAAATEPTAAAGPAPPPEKDALRLETRLVTMNVKALDQAGRAISDLKPSDFTVLEEGVPQEISYFAPVSAPVNLVLLLDLSGSTKEKRKVMIKAVKKFIDVLGPGDRLAIAAFTRKYYVISDFTTDRKLLKGRVDKVKDIEGGTAYYDAMWTTLDLLAKVKAPRKAIVVLTDGEDNSLSINGRWSTEHTFDDLSARVSEEDVTIYPIYLRPKQAGIQINLGGNRIGDHIRRNIHSRRGQVTEIAREQLHAIAEQTAGEVFNADQEQDLDGVYQRVAEELHQLYSLAYDPKNTQLNGQFRKISVAVNRPGSVAKTRRGYFAK